MAKWNTVANAFCATGKGGGQDPSCGKEGGGSGAGAGGGTDALAMKKRSADLAERTKSLQAYKLASSAKNFADKAAKTSDPEERAHLHARAASYHNRAANKQFDYAQIAWRAMDQHGADKQIPKEGWGDEGGKGTFRQRYEKELKLVRDHQEAAKGHKALAKAAKREV